MKKSLLRNSAVSTFGTALLLGQVSAASLDNVRFNDPQLLMFGTNQNFFSGFNYGKAVSPLVTDWDGDGLQDLLLGYMTNPQPATPGLINFYPNHGSKTEPLFSDGVQLPISTNGG